MTSVILIIFNKYAKFYAEKWLNLRCKLIYKGCFLCKACTKQQAILASKTALLIGVIGFNIF